MQGKYFINLISQDRLYLSFEFEIETMPQIVYIFWVYVYESFKAQYAKIVNSQTRRGGGIELNYDGFKLILDNNFLTVEDRPWPL